jgi:hypothetical protein
MLQKFPHKRRATGLTLCSLDIQSVVKQSTGKKKQYLTYCSYVTVVEIRQKQFIKEAAAQNNELRKYNFTKPHCFAPVCYVLLRVETYLN